MNRRSLDITILLGTASFLTVANAIGANAQQEVAQAPGQTAQEQVPEKATVTLSPGFNVSGLLAARGPVG